MLIRPYPARTRGAACRYRPQLEMLEKRLLLRVTLFNNVDMDKDGQFDDFRIVGDKQSSRILIEEDPGAGGFHLAIDADGNGTFGQPIKGDLPKLFFGGLSSPVISILLGGGNDLVSIKAVSDFTGGSRTYLIDLSIGNDRAVFDMQGHSASANTFFDLTVAGGGGANKIELLFNDIAASLVAISVAAGGGSDSLALDFSGSLDAGTRVQADYILGDGNNNFFVNLNGVGDSLGAAAFDLQVDGGRHVDNLQVQFGGAVGNGTVGSFLTFAANLGEGNDLLFLDLIGEFAVRTNSAVRITARGGGGHDILDVDDDFMTQDLEIQVNAGLSISLLGDAGIDIIDMSLNHPLSANKVHLLGNLHVRSYGGPGNDSLSQHLGNTVLSTGNYDVAIYGGHGQDAIGFALLDAGALLSFNPASFILLDGGPGINSLTNGNPLVTSVRFF
jgi:hypothetical protein